MADRGPSKSYRANDLPTYARVRELFSYDPDSGTLTWRISTSNRVAAGSVAGAVSEGRSVIGVDGVKYKTHRIIWLWMTGEPPTSRIDHENGIGLDNRWDNLRLASNSQNMANRGAQANCASGLKGAYFHKAAGLWMSRIKKDGRDYPLGYFNSARAAHAAYAAKARELFGEFARAA